MQLKYFQMKTMRFKAPDIKRAPGENEGGEGGESGLARDNASAKHIFQAAHKEMVQSVRMDVIKLSLYGLNRAFVSSSH